MYYEVGDVLGVIFFVMCVVDVKVLVLIECLGMFLDVWVRVYFSSAFETKVVLFSLI